MIDLKFLYLKEAVYPKNAMNYGLIPTQEKVKKHLMDVV
jgi:hypothetical protein